MFGGRQISEQPPLKVNSKVKTEFGLKYWTNVCWQVVESHWQSFFWLTRKIVQHTIKLHRCHYFCPGPFYSVFSNSVEQFCCIRGGHIGEDIQEKKLQIWKDLKHDSTPIPSFYEVLYMTSNCSVVECIDRQDLIRHVGQLRRGSWE